MLIEVAQAQPNTLVVLTAGGNLDMSRWIDRVRGVLHAFYPGQAGGQALAEMHLRRVNPSGKLPVTFEARAEDRGSFASYFDPDGRRPDRAPRRHLLGLSPLRSRGHRAALRVRFWAELHDLRVLATSGCRARASQRAAGSW